MEIKTLETAGFYPALKSMRLPKKSKGDSKWIDYIENWHDNDDEEPNGLWDTHDGYSGFVAGLEDLKLAQKLIKAGTEHSKCIRGIMVWVKITAPWYWFNEYVTYTVGNYCLSSTSTMHVECRGLTGEELQKAKSEIKGDFEYTRIYTVNYQCLRNMYSQRRYHRLPEWKKFCEWVEKLPLAEELITIGL